MLETDYWIAIQHVELRTKLGDIPKECELSEMSGSFNDLSVTTIKGGKTLIFRSKHRNYDSWKRKKNYPVHGTLHALGTGNDGSPVEGQGLLAQDER